VVRVCGKVRIGDEVVKWCEERRRRDGEGDKSVFIIPGEMVKAI
jgi:hypothetical protein